VVQTVSHCQIIKIVLNCINTARLKVKAECKCAIRRAAVEYENSHLDESAEYFAHRDMNNFWRTWNA